jgi:GMP synthase (glutamine-hydrolysing)
MFRIGSTLLLAAASSAERTLLGIANKLSDDSLHWWTNICPKRGVRRQSDPKKTCPERRLCHHMSPMPESERWSDRYCVYEPILPRIRTMRVLLVDNLVADEQQYSEAARRETDFHPGRWVRFERMVASLAMANIETNIRMLVHQPMIRTLHLADLTEEAVATFDADAIVLSGTLRDFDLYHPELLAQFQSFIHRVTVPVMGICGGHQMIGRAFGAEILTLDGKPPPEKRSGRLLEYQYRFVKITDLDDPIFAGIENRPSPRWQKYTNRRHLLRVWQNHGLHLDRLPTGFTQLARGYLTEVQMMVRRTSRQLIYGTQFHLEKSFQDWQADTYWDHRNESRDGRLLFDNFLVESLRFRGREENLFQGSAPIPLSSAGRQAEDGGQGSGPGKLPSTGF